MTTSARFNVESVETPVTGSAYIGALGCMGSLLLPQLFAGIRAEDRTAYVLRERDGMTDRQIAEVTGVNRETACRRRKRFERVLNTLKKSCTGEQCPMIEQLTQGVG